MLHLYHHGSSVCAAKVRLALAEKGLPWQGTYLDILKGDQFDPEYVKLNPKAVVPTLVHDGKIVTESTLICEYLDDVFPEPSLRPADPYARWQMRHVDQGGGRPGASGLRRAHLFLHAPPHAGAAAARRA